MDTLNTMDVRKKKCSPRRSTPLLLALSAIALSGCSSSAGDESTSAQTPSSSPRPTVSLPPGAEDAWDMGLTGNMVADMGSHYDDLENLDGQDGTFTATQWADHRVEEICGAKTEERIVGGSELDMSIQMLMGRDELPGNVSTGIIQIATSYGCPDRADLVEESIEKAQEYHNS